MIGVWLESLDDGQLQNIADATLWCAYTFENNGAGCLLTHSEGGYGGRVRDRIMLRYDNIASKWQGEAELNGNSDVESGCRYIWARTTDSKPRGPHVERLRSLIQERARAILARRALGSLVSAVPRKSVLVPLTKMEKKLTGVER